MTPRASGGPGREQGTGADGGLRRASAASFTVSGCPPRLIRARVPYNRASAGPADAEREGPTILKERLARAVRPARTVFRKEIGAAVNDAVGPRQAHLEAELRDLRRVLQDDMDAANEATAV